MCHRTDWSSQIQTQGTVLCTTVFQSQARGNTTIDCQLDSEATCNVMSKQMCVKPCTPQTTPTTRNLTTEML